MFGMQFLGTLLCLQHGKRGPEKGRHTKGCVWRSVPREISILFVQRDTQAGIDKRLCVKEGSNTGIAILSEPQ